MSFRVDIGENDLDTNKTIFIMLQRNQIKLLTIVFQCAKLSKILQGGKTMLNRIHTMNMYKQRANGMYTAAGWHCRTFG